SAAENCFGAICHEADPAAVKNCYGKCFSVLATGNIFTTCQTKDGLGKAASRHVYAYSFANKNAPLSVKCLYTMLAVSTFRQICFIQSLQCKLDDDDDDDNFVQVNMVA
ncbi:hypothetical protein Tsp_09423, partial [Trichinella spiralis]|uniref:hypothetical protein n=1 Tax=Trichinella spiralis TaxID=6334 RepID=UPI0001EFD34B